MEKINVLTFLHNIDLNTLISVANCVEIENSYPSILIMNGKTIAKIQVQLANTGAYPYINES